MPTVSVKDTGIRYELRGEGEPLVLIGLRSDGTALANMIEWLAGGWRVLALGGRSAGRAGAPGSIEVVANDTAGLMDAVGIQRAHVLGVSRGAGVGLELALAHPERVKDLILVSAGARTPAHLPSLRVLRGGPFRRAASRGYDCRARLGEIRTPTLILHGRRDRTVPRRLAEELHDGIAGSKLVTFDGGHRFFLERERGEFLEQVEAFAGAHR